MAPVGAVKLSYLANEYPSRRWRRNPYDGRSARRRRRGPCPPPCHFFAPGVARPMSPTCVSGPPFACQFAASAQILDQRGICLLSVSDAPEGGCSSADQGRTTLETAAGGPRRPAAKTAYPGQVNRLSWRFSPERGSFKDHLCQSRGGFNGILVGPASRLRRRCFVRTLLGGGPTFRRRMLLGRPPPQCDILRMDHTTALPSMPFP